MAPLFRQRLVEHQEVGRGTGAAPSGDVSIDALRAADRDVSAAPRQAARLGPIHGDRADGGASGLIVLLSQGLPHYTHVLGKSATTKAILPSRWNITLADVHDSINMAIDDTQQKIQAAYQTATASSRKDTLFKQVLLACALAEVDHLGYFASSDVRRPLNQITGRDYDIPNFSPHLDKFCSADRGNVLEKSGTQRRFRFRFANPLLQPFVIMRGISDKMLTGDWPALLRRSDS